VSSVGAGWVEASRIVVFGARAMAVRSETASTPRTHPSLGARISPVDGEHSCSHVGARGISGADDYGLDPERSSASDPAPTCSGAVALSADDPNLTGSVGPHPEVSCRLAAVVDHYGPNDFLTMDSDPP
jgi:hypothetical protein